MKPIYLLALALAVPAGILIVTLIPDFNLFARIALGMLPAFVVGGAAFATQGKVDP